MRAIPLNPVAIDCSYNFVVQRLRLETSPAALWTGGVGAVAAEKHPHMHLVSVAFEPAKEPSHAVPPVVIVIVVTLVGPAFAVDHKLLIGFGKFLKRNVDIDVFPGAGAKQIFLRFPEFLPAEHSNCSLADAETAIRQGLL